MKRTLLLLAAVLLTVSFSGFAQDTANMNGTVTDKSGAVIPGATVTVSNPDKGFTRVLKSDSAGYFSVSAIPIGDYVVTAEAPGFQKLVRSGITLQVGQIQRIDMQMSVGQVTQEVTVTGNVPKVQTDTAAISSVISNTQIQNLDLNGRNWVSLALLVPGAVPDNGLNTTSVGVYGNNSISFNGNRMQYNNWEIDGGNNTDEGSASTFNTYPNLDTIAEFRISTSNYGADMGKHAGANIEVATKSGTREFHGDAFEYVRNDIFDANDFFINRNELGVNNAPKTPLKWNDYGYTIGGPFYIPGHYNTDKSKTFFFWSEDWRSYRQGQVIGAGVPSLLERQGDFSQCDPKSANYLPNTVGSGCNLPELNGVKYDTVQSMPGFDQQAYTNGLDEINALVPLPNSGPANWTTASSAPTNWRQEQIRVDQNISDKTQAFFRYTQDTWNTLAVPSLWAWASYDTIKTPFSGPGESAVLHITHTFKPNLENEFVAAYTTDHILLYNQGADNLTNGNLNRPSNFAMAHIFPANSGNTLLPSLELCGGLSFCTNEDASNHPWFNSNPIITWKDNVAWVHGGHTTKFGFYLENYRKNEQFGFNTQGALYNGGGGAVTTTNAMADMFLGRIQQYQEGTQVVAGQAVGGYPKGHWQMTDTEPYVQDDWKVTPHLTLNLGVRWYLYTRIHDVTRPTIDSGFFPNLYSSSAEAQLDANGNYIAGTGATINDYGNGLVLCGHNGVPNGCQLRNTAGNIAPRFGFAWDPTGTGKTSVRGGFGMYYESGNGNEAQTEGGEGNPPVAPSPSAFNLWSGTVPGAGYALIAPPSNGLLVPAPGGFTAIPYSQGWPSVYQYSLSVEHEVGTNNIVSIAYVGNLGRDLARALNINEVPIGAGTVNAPALAGLTGSKAAASGAPGDVGQQLCDASGNCNVQNTLIYGEKPNIFFVPYRGYSQIPMKQNTGHSIYNGLQASYRHTFQKGLTLQAAYTWSHALDNSSSTYTNGAGNGYIDSPALNRFYATSDFNRTQVLQLNYIYALPFFKNSSNAFERQAFGGWQISGIYSAFSGEPVNFACGVSGFNSGTGDPVMCDPTGKVAIHKSTYIDPTYGPTLQWWDPGTVSQPQFSELYANNETCMFGCMGRNVLTGPGRNNFDMALEKNFSLPWFNGEHSTMQFRLETFNTFNHTQFQYVNAGCSGSTPFGGSCSAFENGVPGGANVGGGEVNTAWSPRNIQLGLKFIF
ncbi:MAG TPA: carboxypeptidase-like regulatory domain-containing protein [Terriglobia bacterium]|nr:carboxypeptidase-like regulatory domain-containing protein [Terriglobia bacterium]